MKVYALKNADHDVTGWTRSEAFARRAMTHEERVVRLSKSAAIAAYRAFERRRT